MCAKFVFHIIVFVLCCPSDFLLTRLGIHAEALPIFIPTARTEERRSAYVTAADDGIVVSIIPFTCMSVAGRSAASAPKLI